jgi:formate dehydrogenase subunit gamma
MGTLTVPVEPIALSADEARVLSQSHIKKHQVAIVLLHWFNAIVWLVELATGSALIVAPDYRFMPMWYVKLMDDFVGGHANLLRAHIVVGVTWTIVFLAYAVFGWRHYLHTEVLKNEIGIDRDDVHWLRIRLLRLLNRSTENLPPQGVYNAGQKLYALMVYAMIPIIMITGWIMAFHLTGPAVIQWAMLLHFVAAGMVVSGLLVHIYMGAVFPEERPAFYSMITGTVDELYAYKHHFKWWKEVKEQQVEWQARMTSKPDSAENPPKSEAKTALDGGD